MNTYTTIALTPNFMRSLLLCAFISFNMHIDQSLLRFKNFHNKDPKRFTFHIFVLKCCLHHRIPY